MLGHGTLHASLPFSGWGLGPLYHERIAFLLLRCDMWSQGEVDQLLTLYLGCWMWDHGNIYNVLLSDHVCQTLEHCHINAHLVASLLCVWDVATG